MNQTLTVIELINLLESMPDDAQIVLEIVDLQRDTGELVDVASVTYDEPLDVVIFRTHQAA